MVQGRGGKVSTEVNAIKWGQKRGKVDNGKVMEWQKQKSHFSVEKWIRDNKKKKKMGPGCIQNT